MFNYTKEVIINDASIVTADADNKELRIKRVANYKVANILDKAIYKTEPVTGSAGSVAITLPTIPADADTLRLTMFLSTPNVELAEFGAPCWQDFGKPIIVEIAAQNATVKTLDAAIELAAGEYVTTSISEETLTVTGKEKWIDFQDVTLVALLIEDDKETVLAKGTVVPTKAVAEFGTAEWIDHTLRFPSAPNRRYNPLYADELPVRGAEYAQYVFKYVARHNVPGGLSGVDQCVDSITSHVFYVNSTQVADFQAVLTKLGITPTPVDSSTENSSATAPEASMNPYA